MLILRGGWLDVPTLVGEPPASSSSFNSVAPGHLCESCCKELYAQNHVCSVLRES